MHQARRSNVYIMYILRYKHLARNNNYDLFPMTSSVTAKSILKIKWENYKKKKKEKKDENKSKKGKITGKDKTDPKTKHPPLNPLEPPKIQKRNENNNY